jgi:hypothetical protein
VQDFLRNGLRGLFIGRGADGDLQPHVHRFFHEPMDARAQGQLSTLDQFHEQCGLALVHGFHEFIQFLWGNRLGESLGLGVMLHTFLATRDLEQLVVIIHAPLVGEAKFLEGHIERDAVTIALGVNDDAVLVKEHCFYLWHGILLVIARSEATKQSLSKNQIASLRSQ